MVYNHPIFDQRAATIVLLLLAVLSVLAFAGAVVSHYVTRPNSTRRMCRSNTMHLRAVH